MLLQLIAVLHEIDIGEIRLLLLALFPCHIVQHARPQSIMPSALCIQVCLSKLLLACIIIAHLPSCKMSSFCCRGRFVQRLHGHGRNGWDEGM